MASRASCDAFSRLVCEAYVGCRLRARFERIMRLTDPQLAARVATRRPEGALSPDDQRVECSCRNRHAALRRLHAFARSLATARAVVRQGCCSRTQHPPHA